MEDNKKSEKKIDKKVRTKYILAVIIIIAVFVIDQGFKIYSANYLQGVNVDSGFGLTYAQNYSGAFGVKYNSKAAYCIATIVVLGLLASFVKKQAARLSKTTIVVLSLIFAGGLSNVIDKLIHGYVIDYIKIDKLGLPITSIAEILMILSWVVLAAIFAKATYKDIKNSRAQEPKRKLVDKDAKKEKSVEKENKEDKEEKTNK